MQGTIFYPGRFSPPTAQHLNTAQYLTRREKAYQVIIVLGKDETNEIDQDDKADLWRLLLNSESATNISIEKAKDTTSMMYIYNKLLKEPNADYSIAIDEASGRKESFAKHFEKFPNIHIELIPSQFDASSKNMMKAIAEDDIDTLKRFLPESFSEDDIASVIEILKPDTEAPDESSEQLKERMVQSFGKDYWNMSLGLDEAALTEAKNEFKQLEKNKIPLSPEERSQVMSSKAVWHHGPNGAESPAVWKSKNPKTGKFTYITNTHRAWNKAPTLKGAISRYHKFIKGTA